MVSAHGKKTQHCILVQKVFDNCFKPISLSSCHDIPHQCLPLPTGATATCTVLAARCVVVAVGPPDPVTNIRQVTVRIEVDKRIDIFDAAGTLVCTFNVTVVVFESTAVFAPAGTDVQCEVTASCGPCQFSQDQKQVCCEQAICLIVETKAFVKLCVPAEICVPRECPQALPECPPPPPPQLVDGLCPDDAEEPETHRQGG